MKYCLALIIIMLISSCSKRTNILDSFRHEYSIKSENINLESGLISSPGKIILYEDENFLLKEEFKNEKLLQKIFLRKDSTFQFIDRGNGPNEYSGLKLYQKEKNGTFWALDQKKQYMINMDTEGNKVKQIKFSRTIFNIIHIDSFFIASGYYENINNVKNGRFLILNSQGDYINSFGNYPNDNIEVDNYLKLFAYQGNIVHNYNNKRIAFMTRFGVIFDIYEFKDGRIKEIINNHYTYASYDSKKMNNASGVAYNKENIFGFIDVCSTDKYIYAIYSGKSLMEYPNKNIEFIMSGNMVLVYDWNGIPICKLNTDLNLVNICVDKNNKTLFGLSCNDDYKLHKFNLPNEL